MSLYSQSQQYAQPYPSANFSQPPIHGGYQYPPPAALPPPQPIFHIDPVTFRRDYSNRLSELSVNSRPIIQNLSLLAQEFSRYAEIVAQCLETHIRRVPPWMKLPAFYLLDAISKNVYDPYARQFSGFVIPLFLETYNQVDQNTRSKMEEMLLTWRNGSPTGRELFGVPAQVAIERGVWGDGSNQNSGTGFHTGGQITKAQVLSELEFTLGQKERAVQANPYDSTSQNHINVLQQLRKVVESGAVSSEELLQILNQLRSLVRTAPPPPPPPQLPPAPAPHWPSHQPHYLNPMQPSYPPPSSYSYPASNGIKNEGVKIELGPLPPVASSSTPVPGPSAPLANNIANLLSTLMKAGVVSANGTPTGAGATSKEEDFKPEPMDLERESSRAYRKSILAHKIKLTSADITKKQPQVVKFLYDQLAAQCKQCGIRFADTSVGKKKMEDHLDMHFRQNRKANQNIGRGHSRSWFTGLEDWIHDISVDVKGKGRAGGSRPMNAKAAAAAEIAKRDAELRALYVVVPPGDEAKPISCPICKESFKSEFLEDDEDWVWKNAVMKDDRVYHATCHAEAVASTNSLAARLRTELAPRSRSGTPEASRLTPPKSTPSSSTLKSELRQSLTPTPDKSQTPPQELTVGTKRKVDDRDTTLTGEADGTPPFKKLALSVA